jgi:hypothetical protein
LVTSGEAPSAYCLNDDAQLCVATNMHALGRPAFCASKIGKNLVLKALARSLMVLALSVIVPPWRHFGEPVP